jgi:hypothetical protein
LSLESGILPRPPGGNGATTIWEPWDGWTPERCKASYRGHLGEIRSEWTCGADGAEWKVTIPPNCTAGVTIPPRFPTITLDGRPLREVVADAAASADGTTFELGSGDYVFALAR